MKGPQIGRAVTQGYILMAVTLQSILQASFAAYVAAQQVPRRVWRAARALMAVASGIRRPRAPLPGEARHGGLV